MSKHAFGRTRSLQRSIALVLGAAAMSVASAALGTGTAGAEVEESAPAPYVTSRQALIIDDNALRVADYGQARGFLDTRSADAGIVHA